MRFRLKEFRQSHKLFQADMASILEANQSSISRMELRPSCKLTHEQYGKLYERFGKEDVEAFIVEDEKEVFVTGNTNEGDGIQNNGVFGNGDAEMDIIKQQSEIISRLATKQGELTDKLIALLEKISEKL